MPLPVVNPANEEFDEGIDEIIEDLEPARSKSEVGFILLLIIKQRTKGQKGQKLCWAKTVSKSRSQHYVWIQEVKGLRRRN